MRYRDIYTGSNASVAVLLSLLLLLLQMRYRDIKIGSNASVAVLLLSFYYYYLRCSVFVFCFSLFPPLIVALAFCCCCFVRLHPILLQIPSQSAIKVNPTSTPGSRNSMIEFYNCTKIISSTRTKRQDTVTDKTWHFIGLYEKIPSRHHERMKTELMGKGGYKKEKG